MENRKRRGCVELDIGVISRILDCTDAFGSTPEDHIKWIKEKIKDESLSHSSIEVIFNDYELFSMADYPSPRISVRFEKIDFDISESFGIEIPAYSYPDGSSGIELFFSFCDFIDSGNTRFKIDWLPDGNSILYFTNCKFVNIDSSIMFDLSSSSSIFLNECEIINGEIIFREGDLADIKKSFLPRSLDYKIHNVNIFKPEPRSKVYIGQEELLPSITVVDSKIDSLRIIGKINSFFRGKNIFRSLGSSEYSFEKFYWGGYQKFSITDDDVFLNRIFFLDLNKNDTIQNDAFQLLTVQKELAKCHYSILRSEGRLAWQDRILFRISDMASHNGTCWVTAVTWFLILNLFVMIPFDFMESVLEPNDWNGFFHIYFQLLNPVKLPSMLFEIKNNGLASFFDAIHKIIYVLLSYELVKTLRRFGRSNSTPPRS